MNVTRADIVAEARTWIDTPFVHQGREKGFACDCIGHILGIAWVFGMTDFDFRHYTPGHSDSKAILDHLDKMAIRIPIEQMDIGDIVTMYFAGPGPTHLGILTPRPKNSGKFGIIHAMYPMGKVKEHRLSTDWMNRIRRAYQYPGVID